VKKTLNYIKPEKEELKSFKLLNNTNFDLVFRILKYNYETIVKSTVHNNLIFSK